MTVRSGDPPALATEGGEAAAATAGAWSRRRAGGRPPRGPEQCGRRSGEREKGTEREALLTDRCAAASLYPPGCTAAWGERSRERGGREQREGGRRRSGRGRPVWHPQGRKEPEGEGPAGVAPARAAVAAPRSGHRRGALAPPPCPFRERSGGRGRERKRSDEGGREEEEEIFLPEYCR